LYPVFLCTCLPPLVLYSGLLPRLYSALVLLVPAASGSGSCSGSCSLSYYDFSLFVILTVAVRVLVCLPLSFLLPSLGTAPVVFLVRCRSPLSSPLPDVPPIPPVYWLSPWLFLLALALTTLPVGSWSPVNPSSLESSCPIALTDCSTAGFHPVANIQGNLSNNYKIIYIYIDKLIY
jgi:hypothetical protein